MSVPRDATHGSRCRIHLKSRVLLPLVAALLVLLVAVLYATYEREQRHIRSELQQLITALNDSYLNSLDDRSAQLALAADWVLGQPGVVDAVASADRVRLLGLSNGLFSRLQRRYHVTHFYFHAPDRTNLLRVHQPQRHGDRIDRFTLQTAARSGTYASGVELGPMGTLTLRGVTPVRRDGRVVGYLELGEEVDGILHRTEDVFGVRVYEFIDKTYLKRSLWESGMRMLGRIGAWDRFSNEVIADPGGGVLAPLDALGLAALEGSGGKPVITSSGDRTLGGGAVALQDVAGRDVGRLLVLKDITPRWIGLYHTLESMAGAVIGVGLLLVLGFNAVLGRTERQMRASRQALLEQGAEHSRTQESHIAELQAEQGKLRGLQQALEDSETRLLNAQRMARLGSWEWAVDGTQIHLSDEFRRIVGLADTVAAVDYSALLDRVPAQERDSVRGFIAAVRNDGLAREMEHRIRRTDGQERVVLQHAGSVRGVDGRVVRLNGTVQDITEWRNVEKAALSFGRVMEHSWNEIYILDAQDLRVLQASDGACRNLGYSAELLQGMQLGEVLTDLKPSDVLEYLAPLIRGEQHGQTLETVFRRQDGSLYPVEVRFQYSADDVPPVLVAIAQDVSERRAYMAELERKALYDDLTGLANRNLFTDRLGHTIKHARREVAPVAVLLFDLDRLREVNDILGHSKGDKVLRQVASRLQQAFRESDTLARLGGDEFGLVLPNVGREGIEAVVAKIHRIMEAPILVEDIPLEVHVSIGVAFFPEHSEDAASLVRHADVAMKFAKQEQRGYGIYEPTEDPYSLRRLRLYGDLRQAINCDDLVLCFQPKLHARRDRVTSVEALVRWNHGEQGTIAPDEFIPFAEYSGLIRPLTGWVLDNAMEQCARWRSAGLDLDVAVNISARDLADPTLPERIAHSLRVNGLSSDNLTLEITESAVMVRLDSTLRVLRQLDGMGLRIAIDDFGTGYSSLSYLKKLPVRELKIDKTFVMSMMEDESDAVIVRSTIELAHNLGLGVIAEGVESQDVLDALTILDCDYLQGYHISRPLPADAFYDWYTNSRWGELPGASGEELEASG